MSYLTAADFRTATLSEFCQGLSLTTGEASDTLLTNAITRVSLRVDDMTDDHYEPQTLTYDLDGEGTPTLYLPGRCSAVSSVKIRSEDGTLGAAEASTAYRLLSSLNSTGDKRIRKFDTLELIYGGSGLVTLPLYNDGVYCWPNGIQTVQVTGTFGWTTTPGDIKRAVALLVYDLFKPVRADLNRGTAYTAEGIAITLTGLPPEAQDIINDYQRETRPHVGIA